MDFEKTLNDTLARRNLFSEQLNYNQEVYKNIFNLSSPSPISVEYALSLMFQTELEKNAWCCKYAPFKQGEKTNSLVHANEFHYTKDKKTILVIFGDGIVQQQRIKKLPDLVITDSCKFLWSKNVFHMDPELYGIYETVIENDYEDRAPSKLFNCFMAAPSATRQCWLYELTRKELLDKGNISYRLANRALAKFDDDLPGKIKTFDSYSVIGPNKIFSAEHQWLRPQMPYKNFDSSLEQAIIDSKISVVIETEYDYPQQMFFTEKTFRAMLMPRPFMIFASGRKTGGIQCLRNIGFDMHDDIIDHSYDEIEDPVHRLNKMIRQIQTFETFEFTELILEKLRVRAEKNLSLIKKLRNNLGKKFQLALDKVKEIS